jgi:hypothetical protein
MVREAWESRGDYRGKIEEYRAFAQSFYDGWTPQGTYEHQLVKMLAGIFRSRPPACVNLTL